MNIYIGRLTTGEWIIGEDLGDSDDGFTLRRPRVLVPIVKDGKQVYGLVPYFPLDADAETVLNPESLQSYVTKEFHTKDLENLYIEATTDIQIAKPH